MDDEAGAAAALRRIEKLDRGRVRETFGRRFSTRRMMEEYLKVYQKLAQSGRSSPSH
ncbi:MAG TPA: hypothetical protein VJ770_21435 [Stellaceae bacterium]|nr:hypothetical protein [Stellaceae bacterium]